MWLAVLQLVACSGAPETQAPIAPTEPPSEPIYVPPPAVAEPVAPAEPPPVELVAEPTVQPTPPKPIDHPKPADPPPVVIAPAPVEPPPVADPPAVVTPPTTTYTLDPHQGRLYVVSHIDDSTMLASMGHDHAIGATGWSGTVVWPNEPGAPCSVDIVVPVSGLVVDPPGYRTAAGLDPQEVSEADKAKITENFRGKRQLDMEKFPNIEFHATSCTPSGSSMKVAGDFTMHGVTRTKTVTITSTVADGSFRAKGSFAIDGSDYGMDPFTAAAGALRNLDRLEFTLDLKGSAR